MKILFKKKEIKIRNGLAYVLFISLLSCQSIFAQDIIDPGQPVQVIGTTAEPIVPIPDDWGVLINEEGNIVPREESNLINDFIGASITIDTAVPTLNQKTFSNRTEDSRLYLPIEICDNSGNCEESGIFTSPLTGSIASCVLPPKNKKIKCGSELYTFNYDFLHVRKCNIPATTYGCSTVSISIKYRFMSSPYIFQFCFNSTNKISGIVGGWLGSLKLGKVDWTANGNCNYEIPLCENETPTAILLSTFSIKPGNKSAVLTWETGDETNNFGFNVYRSEAQDGGFVKINEEIVLSKGGSGIGSTYTFTDTKLQNGKKYFYLIEDIAADGTATIHDETKQSVTPLLFYGLLGR
ncbi:MAG: hypothetical protein WCQ99_03585 [Pseudomonadota bacterium]